LELQDDSMQYNSQIRSPNAMTVTNGFNTQQNT